MSFVFCCIRFCFCHYSMKINQITKSISKSVRKNIMNNNPVEEIYKRGNLTAQKWKLNRSVAEKEHKLHGEQMELGCFAKFKTPRYSRADSRPAPGSKDGARFSQRKKCPSETVKKESLAKCHRKERTQLSFSVTLIFCAKTWSMLCRSTPY